MCVCVCVCACVCACVRVCVFQLSHKTSMLYCSVADAAHGHVRGDLVQLCKEGNTNNLIMIIHLFITVSSVWSTLTNTSAQTVGGMGDESAKQNRSHMCVCMDRSHYWMISVSTVLTCGQH